jgi:hypothetical protein
MRKLKLLSLSMLILFLAGIVQSPEPASADVAPGFVDGFGGIGLSDTNKPVQMVYERVEMEVLPFPGQWIQDTH